MNQQEAELMIGEAIIAGVMLPAASEQDLVDKASVWSDFCHDVPLDFARGVVREFPTAPNRFLTPNRLSNEWHDSQRAQQTAASYPEAACAWARFCRCDHESCFHGQMRDAEERLTIINTPKGEIRRYTTATRWCPRCWDARNLKRADVGKEFRDYGDMTP